MRRFHQTEWHGIEFRSFAELDPDSVAGPAFYDAFYEALFDRCHGWEDLDPRWRAAKDRVAELIGSRLPGSRVLSLGCGLGYVEKRLLESFPEIEVTESGSTPLRWLAPLLKPGHAHVGPFPTCLDEGALYGLIYMSAVDYCFAQDEWVGLLREVRGRLEPSGRCLVISASFEGRLAWMRAALREAFVRLSWRERGQLWGFTRSRREHRSSLVAAGFGPVRDGFLEDGSYWIEGLKT